MHGRPSGNVIGEVLPKRSTESRDYLLVKLDDLTFNAPIYANFFESAETYALIGSHSRKPNGG